MRTDFEIELLQAAEDATRLCEEIHMGIPIPGGETCVFRDRASRYRQRAAWVRELEARWALAPHGYRDAFAALTGPIPAAETAPTESTEP